MVHGGRRIHRILLVHMQTLGLWLSKSLLYPSRFLLWLCWSVLLITRGLVMITATRPTTGTGSLGVRATFATLTTFTTFATFASLTAFAPFAAFTISATFTRRVHKFVTRAIRSEMPLVWQAPIGTIETSIKFGAVHSRMVDLVTIFLRASSAYFHVRALWCRSGAWFLLSLALLGGWVVRHFQSSWPCWATLQV
jgi:hypothetical protein